RTGQVRELPHLQPSPVRVVERRVRERETRDLADARVVVAVGRGFAAEDDLGLARELAEVLGGEIGCTRPLSEEMHWLPDQACIGLSGVQVKPELYLGIGISGQIQHLTGARGAKVIAAVNQDENAPIFGAADLGIVGDLYQVLPALVREMRKQS
ncbi:MAG: electron transfer flavoprotein subunit alpha/FixB family protein, partial [Thermodesulfobacteriota bacterium]